MNKKMMLLSLLTVFVLLSVSIIATGVTTTKTTSKESPLYKIKIRTKLGEEVKEIKINFLKNRIFLRLPLVKYIIENDGTLPSGAYQCFSWLGFSCNTLLDCKQAKEMTCQSKC